MYLSLSDVCAILFAMCLMFLLMCTISLLHEQKTKAQTKIQIAQNVMYPTWHNICESALLTESQQTYFISTYGE